MTQKIIEFRNKNNLIDPKCTKPNIYFSFNKYLLTFSLLLMSSGILLLIATIFEYKNWINFNFVLNSKTIHVLIGILLSVGGFFLSLAARPRVKVGGSSTESIEQNIFIITINIVLSIIYSVLSISIFILTNLISIGLPLLIIFAAASDKSSSHSTGKDLFGIVGITVFILNIIGYCGALKTVVLRLLSLKNKGVDRRVSKLVEKVCEKVGTRPFRGIYLSKKNIAETVYNMKGRYLGIGMLPLRYLTVHEIKAVIAHECAHYFHGSMVLYRAYYLSNCLWNGFYNSYIFSAKKVVEKPNFVFNSIHGMALICSLGIFLSFALYQLYMNLMGKIIRDKEYEYYCDTVSANKYGGNVVSSALVKYTKLQIAEEILLYRGVDFDSFTFLNEFDNVYNQRTAMKHLNSSFNKDTRFHPSLKSRCALLSTFPNGLNVKENLLTEKELKEMWLNN